MSIRNETEELLNALKGTYFSGKANGTIEYLQGECKLLSLLRLDLSRKWQPGELSKKLDVSTARIAATLRTLENKKYIKRETSTEDKRKVYVTITDEGAEYTDSRREEVCNFFDKRLKHLTPKERKEFIRIITKLSEITD